MSRINKEDIKINAYDKKIDIKTDGESAQRKYHKILDLPKASCSGNNKVYLQ
jgi:HSP20 family molecular chaperone IbpA